MMCDFRGKADHQFHKDRVRQILGLTREAAH